jgi:hypothetical protein
MLVGGKFERYTECVVVQYYNLGLKGRGNVAAATAIVALEKREQCSVEETVSDIEAVLWCNITM